MQVTFDKIRKFAGQTWLEVSLPKGPLWINCATITTIEPDAGRVIFRCADGSGVTAAGDVESILGALQNAD